jgi:hypothetical protein
MGIGGLATPGGGDAKDCAQAEAGTNSSALRSAIRKRIGGRNDPSDSAFRNTMHVRADLLFGQAAGRSGCVRIADEIDAIPAPFGFANGRVDAKLGLHSAYDYAFDPESFQHVV